ncbi:hypothetical protein WI40_26520 [Burkholderia ubonensis]|nr:hypothetical protein WI40_26520 [Burkholderia ubonensis]
MSDRSALVRDRTRTLLLRCWTLLLRCWTQQTLAPHRERTAPRPSGCRFGDAIDASREPLHSTALNSGT